jgi:hypothetical protein
MSKDTKKQTLKCANCGTTDMPLDVAHLSLRTVGCGAWALDGHMELVVRFTGQNKEVS